MAMGKILGIIFVQEIIGDEVRFDKIKVVANRNFIIDKPIKIISGGHQWEEYYYVTDEIKKQLNTRITNMVKIISNNINTFINERR
jgi:hypothetical protein